MPHDTLPASAPATAAPPDARLAIVRAAVPPLHVEPRVSSAQTSQALAGHPVLLLEERPDHWCRVVGEDGYPGWMHAGYARRATPDELRRALGVVPEIVPVVEDVPSAAAPGRRPAVDPDALTARISLGCTVDAPYGPRPLPLGAWVAADERVVDGEAISGRERGARFPRTAERIARDAAALFAGTSYQWGGVTPWGADCSGFVQSLFGLHGCPLPRDAWQQALLGTDVGREIGALRAADLLFFSDREDGRITHVGVALGDSRMAHVALGHGGFAVDRLDDTRDQYVARLRDQLRATRRVLQP